MKAKFQLLFTITIIFTFVIARGQDFIIDHNYPDLSQIPNNIIDSIKTNIRFQWCGQSHSHQIPQGLKFIEADYPNFDVTVGDGTNGISTYGGWLPPPNGTLCVMDGLQMFNNNCGNCCIHIEPTEYWNGPNYFDNFQKTFELCFPTINVSGFMWCDELETASASYVDSYLATMELHETEYPGIQFIYTTANAQVGGSAGYNRHLRNEQIRQYCRDHNKVLFDFADLDAWSDGEFSYYIYSGDTIPTQHPDYESEEWNHTNELGCENKGKATWYMLAKLCGWQQTSNNNNPPQIENQSFSIDENSDHGTVVGIVTASDPDAGQSLSFSIISGNTDNAFQINSLSGELSVNNNTALNFETNPTFNLTVKVEDNGQGNLSDQATVTVNLNDLNEVPEIEDQSFSIDENSANGDPVGTVVASDPDNGQSLTFSILSGNTNNAFQINQSSGQISVQNNSVLDFETNPTFNLTVAVEDDGQGNLSNQATMTVNLNDINEPPAILSQSLSIDLDALYLFGEFNNNIHSVGMIAATDPDAGQSLQYSILDGNARQIWDIDEVTGELLMSNPYRINFVENFDYNLLIGVEDNSPEPLSASAPINIHVHVFNISEYFENPDFLSGQSNKKADEPTYHLYPNPANGRITLEMLNTCEGLTDISILDIQGNIVRRKSIAASGKAFKEVFDLTGFGNGVYFIAIQTPDAIFIDKFIKN